MECLQSLLPSVSRSRSSKNDNRGPAQHEIVANEVHDKYQHPLHYIEEVAREGSNLIINEVREKTNESNRSGSSSSREDSQINSMSAQLGS